MILRTLRRIVQEVNAALDLTQALGLLVLRVKEALQADACSSFFQ